MVSTTRQFPVCFLIKAHQTQKPRLFSSASLVPRPRPQLSSLAVRITVIRTASDERPGNEATVLPALHALGMLKLMLDLLAFLFSICCLLRNVETAMSSASAEVCGIHETAHQHGVHNQAPTSNAGDHSTRDEIQCQQLVPYEPVRFLPFQDPKREFVFASKKWVILQQWNEIGLAAVVWEAAIALCQYLETLGSSTLSGRRVIELGAGTGLAGMVASALGAQSVVLTDRNTAPAEANLQLNRHNLEGRTIGVSHLEWGVEEDVTTFNLPFDVVLAADVVYVEESFPLLIKSLDDLTDSHTLVLLSCKHRYESYMKFFQLLQEKFDSEIVWYNQDIKVYRCTKK